MPIFLAIIGSRIGQIALALIIGMGVGWWKTSAHCNRKIAAIEAARVAANAEELSRQEQAAREIAAEATKRLVEEQNWVRENDLVIAELRKDESHDDTKQIVYQGRKVYASSRPCRIDSDFRRRLLKLRP